MTKQEITQYLTELGQEILSLGRHAEIAIAGGAAMILLVGNREATRDIDAYLGADPMLVREAAKAVAERHALAEDWIHDGARASSIAHRPRRLRWMCPPRSWVQSSTSRPGTRRNSRVPGACRSQAGGFTR